MPSTNSGFRAVLGLCLLLTAAITATGFVSSAYRREKQRLGETHYIAGKRLEAQSDVNGAIEQYRKALLFNPDSADYRLSFASALLDAGHLDEAEAHVDQLLQEDPTNGELNLLRGRIASRRHAPSKAIEYYQRAVYEYWPPSRVEERRRARLELVSLLAQTGRREELIGELMTMYANAPSDRALQARIGLSLLDHGATSEASQVFRELVRTEPKSAEAHRGLAQSFFASGQYISARHEFERALRLNPHDTISANNLKLTNAVVDLDPDLAGIRESERRRRAQNLLRRVLADITQCASSSFPPEEADAAHQLLDRTPTPDDDTIVEIRKKAEDLWKSRQKYCNGHPTEDNALATILSRFSTES